MADTLEDWSSRVTDDPRRAWVDGLLALRPPNARVAELGCGNGTQLLRDAGFELLRDETVTIAASESDVTFHWVLARR
jgi:hypothetical protein